MIIEIRKGVETYIAASYGAKSTVSDFHRSNKTPALAPKSSKNALFASVLASSI